ncbi:MAG: quinone-dependent dihydroorotate dehydrogenase [Acidiferrobacterales bacterium]
MYKLLRPLLFLLDAERSHQFAFLLLRIAYLIPGIGALVRLLLARRTPQLPVEVMGLHFPNPVGLAAGLDKNARYVRELTDFGFGWLELGTVTPRPQPGNPKKRLFRIISHAALINRMGFNNVGVDTFVRNLRRKAKSGIIGINIGKNGETSTERAVDDYLEALRVVYPYADYVVINVSSPNTPGLRDLQAQEKLNELLRRLKQEQAALQKTRGIYVPMTIKIAPDLDENQIAAIAKMARDHKLDAVIATNTTLSRPGMEGVLQASEEGGLSGRPLKALSTEVIRRLYGHLRGTVPIIGVGGVESAADAWDKLVAGADLLQIYTVLTYDGPGIVRKIVSGLAERVRSSGCAKLVDAVAKARMEKQVGSVK